MMVYIIQIDPPLAGRARFYIGYCKRECPYYRLHQHRKGKGAKITAAAVKAGCQLKVVASFPYEGRKFERWLKSKKSTGRYLDHLQKIDSPYLLRGDVGWNA